MDIDMIENTLNDDCICFGATKETFIKSLREKFNDTLLKNCKLSGKVFKHKKKENVYSIIINPISNTNRIKIFEKNGEISELKNFFDIKTETDYYKLIDYDFYFFEDERIGFMPTSEYLFLKSECEYAIKEIDKNVVKTFTTSDIKQWLDKYALIYELICDKYSIKAYHEFRGEYLNFKYMYEQLIYAKQAKQAVLEYQTNDFYCINDWCDKYYRLALCKVLHFELFLIVFDKTNKIIQDKFLEKRYYKGDDFLDIIEFNELFSRILANVVLNKPNN
jgi:hypothetical protein